jgi:O-antigen/teichoic acid export membrane protein
VAGDARTAGDARGLIAGAAITLAGGALGGGLNILNEILVARFMGPASYGLYAIAVVLARIGETLSLFGLGVGTLHFLPIHKNAGRRGLMAGTILGAAILPAGLGCGLASALWVGAPWLAASVFNNTPATPYIRLTALAIPLMSLSEVLGVVSRAFGRVGYHVAARNLVPQLTFLSVVAGVMVLGMDPLWIAGGMLAAYMAACATGVAGVALSAGPVLRVRPELRLGELYGYCLPILLNGVLYLVMGWTDILILGVFASSDQVGIYRVCIQFALIFDIVVLAVNTGIAGRYAVLSDEGRKDDLALHYNAANRWVSAVCVPMFLAIALNARDLLSLMGAAFVGGQLALSVLCFGQLCKSCLGSAGFVLVLSGNQRVETWNAAGACAVNVVANLALVPRLGAAGAALATASSYLAFTALRLVQLRSLLHLPTFTLPFVRLQTSAPIFLIVLLVGFAALNIADGNGETALLVRAAVLVFLSPIWIWCFVVTPEDCSVLHELWRTFSRDRAAPASRIGNQGTEQ